MSMHSLFDIILPAGSRKAFFDLLPVTTAANLSLANSDFNKIINVHYVADYKWRDELKIMGEKLMGRLCVVINIDTQVEIGERPSFGLCRMPSGILPDDFFVVGRKSLISTINTLIRDYQLDFMFDSIGCSESDLNLIYDHVRSLVRKKLMKSRGFIGFVA
jgi:hypothetical protein